ncbi:MAG TPA: hypothetical protein VE996_09220 [Terriglobales bacterium]|nr:hypothetical protein [Terriglobales bacterium]
MPRPILTAVFCLAFAYNLSAATTAPPQVQKAPSETTIKVTASDSLGELAREERAARGRAAAAVHEYTNGNIPQQGAISVPGQAAAAAPSSGSEAATATAAPAAPAASDDAQLEAQWRKKFADARQQLQLDQQELDVNQREFNLAQQQYYSDPNKALQQQYSRSDLDQKAQQINALKAKVAADQKAISDLTDQLRQAGLPPSWAQ